VYSLCEDRLLFQALKVYVPAFESGGRMWPHLHSRILASLFIAQITMIGYFAVKQFVYAPVLIFLPPFTIFFSYICKMNYYPAFQVTSLAIASEEVKEIPAMRKVVEAYTPECLLLEEGTIIEESDKFEDAESSALSRLSSRTNSGIPSNEEAEELYAL
jgi:hypothetical protein